MLVFDRRRGFTLIELLVVIAIIAILAAILFPIFSAAKRTAQKSSCVSNMRQIAYAYRGYLDDFDETYPSNDLGANLFLVDPYLKQKRFKQGSSKWANSVWLCPAADKDMYYNVQPNYWIQAGSPVPWGSAPQIQVFVSYVLNNDMTVRRDGKPAKVNDAKQPSQMVLFAEGCHWPTRKGGGLGTCPTAVHPTEEPQDVTGWCHHIVPGSSSELHPWHNGGANFLYVDFHLTFHSQPPTLEHWRRS